MSVVYGTVRSNVVVLPEGTQLPEGSTVEIRLPRRRSRRRPVVAVSVFNQQLLKAGLLTEIRPTLAPTYPAAEPVALPGKPLSEIVFEDRR
jgi:hypothetical protein